MNIDALKLAAASFKSALQRDDRQALIAAGRQLIALEAPIGDQWLAASQALFRWGELDLALNAINNWHRQGATAAAANYEKATLLSRAGQTARAHKLVEALPPDFPSPVANAYLRGALAINLGRTAEAEAQFRRALRAAPDSGRSWQGIAQFAEIDAADFAAMKKLAAATRFVELEDHAAVENALGLAEHKRGHHAAAFAHFDASTRIVRQDRPHERADNERSAQLASSWTSADILRFSQAGPEGARKPLFVTGLPRSGTTLVQQILTAHSAVDSGGELGLAMQLEAIVDGLSPEDVSKYLTTAGGMMSELRHTYLRLVAERIPGEGAFVDKSLNQSRSLGLFAALFPDAPILWLRRDPLDNAWSLFRTWMSRSAVGGWSLEDIAHHMKLEDRLLEHWTRELGSRILVVPYEELVAAPRDWIERITAHCGLQVEPAQFDFHKSGSGVTTASSIQVREPINRRGIGTAEPYRLFLGPFIDAYFDQVEEPSATASPKTASELGASLLDALKRNARGEVRAIVIEMLETNAQIGSQWRAVAQVMLHDGEFALARRAADAFAQAGQAPAARFEAATVHARAARPEAAYEIMASLQPDVPSIVANGYVRGTTAMNLGRMEEARAHQRRAIAADPGSGQAWLGLAMAGGLDADNGAQLASLEDRFASAPDNEAAPYFTALGRWKEKQGDHVGAFEAFRRSGAILSRSRPYDPAQDRADVEAIMRDWSPEAIERLSAESGAPPPIFVTGLPRSGTTLVEQILASNNVVAGGGEIEILRQCARLIGGKGPHEIEAFRNNRGSLREAAALYTRLAEERFGSGRIADKSLSTSRLAGLGAVLFPNAPFVWLRRNVEDCALSAFRSYFADGVAWSQSIETIAQHFALEERLFRFWQGTLGDRMHVLEYESLVGDPESSIRRLAAHCGLAFEDAMLEPQLNERAVITNSAAQVREPINLRGIGASQPYRELLKPFDAILAAELGVKEV